MHPSCEKLTSSGIKHVDEIVVSRLWKGLEGGVGDQVQLQTAGQSLRRCKGDSKPGEAARSLTDPDPVEIRPVQIEVFKNLADGGQDPLTMGAKGPDVSIGLAPIRSLCGDDAVGEARIKDEDVQ